MDTWLKYQRHVMRNGERITVVDDIFYLEAVVQLIQLIAYLYKSDAKSHPK